MLSFQTSLPILKGSTRTINLKRAVCSRIPRTSVVCCTTPRQESAVKPKLDIEPGQIVLTPGKWSNEDGVALVEGVRFVETRGAYVVDVLQLRRAEKDIFEVVPRGRGKSPYTWYDVADVRLAADAEYIETRKAYKVAGARDGYAVVPPMNEEMKAAADAQYKELKRYMLGVASAFGLLGTIGCALFIDTEHARAFGLGAIASVAYLSILQKNVDMVGEKDSWLKKALGLRFAFPVLPFAYFAKSIGSVGDGSFAIPPSEVAAMTIGLLSYKIPVLLKTASELFDSMAEIEPGTSGMLGTVMSLTARTIRAKRNEKQATDSDEKIEPSRSFALVFAGPSGVGKSTLIRRLEADYSENIDFSISHTTRSPREREKDGEDYFFVEKERFEKMIEKGEFIEFASVHGNYYGTSFEAVNRVISSGKICIIDIDVKGVESLRKQTQLEWQPYFVWVAPPSFEVLEERLRSRGTETEASLKMRLDTAKRELEFAAINNIFDLTIINDDLGRSYDELKSFFESLINRRSKLQQ